MREQGAGDEGMTLIEIVIAMMLVTVGVLALLTEVVTYMREQNGQRAHAVALRVATTTLEDARRRPDPQLTPGVYAAAPTTVNGVSYSSSTTVVPCDASVQTSCVSPTPGAASAKRVLVTVTWTDQRGTHHLRLDSSTTDTTQSAAPGNTSSLTGGASGLSLTVGALGLSPASVSVDSSGHPFSDVTVSLPMVGLAGTSTIPLTWSDDAGAHQVSLTSNGTGTTWTATIPKNAITELAAATSRPVVFSATVPGTGLATVTATLTVVPQPAFSGSCSVIPTPILLLLRKTTVPEVMSCSTVGLSVADTVKVAYASGSSTATASLSTLDGSTWTATLPVATPMVGSGSTESLTFTLTRTSDGYTKSQSLSAALA